MDKEERRREVGRRSELVLNAESTVDTIVDTHKSNWRNELSTKTDGVGCRNTAKLTEDRTTLKNERRVPNVD